MLILHDRFIRQVAFINIFGAEFHTLHRCVAGCLSTGTQWNLNHRSSGGRTWPGDIASEIELDTDFLPQLLEYSARPNYF
jgi:hypothetical protein